MHQECEGGGMYSPMFTRRIPEIPWGFTLVADLRTVHLLSTSSLASVSLDEYFIVTQRTADAHEELQDV
jgi:hypothetical protein